MSEVTEAIPTTVAELNAWLAERFHCVDGPPRAYFELPLSTVSGGPAARFAYHTYAIAMHGKHPESVLVRKFHELLVQALNDSAWYQESIEFDSMGSPLLFWRRPIKFEVLETIDGGACMSKISARFTIPGVTQTLEVQS